MIDPIRLQALVDGEFSAAERRRVLSQIDDQPEQWRELALALLEEQTFRNEIRLMRSEASTVPRDEPNSVPLASLTGSSEAYNGRVKKHWYTGPVLAACLMLSVGIAIGRFVMRGDMGSVPWGSNSGGLLVNDKTTHSDSDRLNGLTQEEYEKSLPVADLRMPNNGYEIPVYDVNQVDPALVYAKRAYEIEKAKEQLRRNGYDVDLQHNYLTGQLQDGRKVVVPIQEVGLRPYGQ
jgi:hypothetical protein